MYNLPPKGRAHQGHKRVLRGGSWNNNGRNLRSANRNSNTPDNRNNHIGLRLAGALWAGGSVNQRFVLFHGLLMAVDKAQAHGALVSHWPKPCRWAALP